MSEKQDDVTGGESFRFVVLNDLHYRDAEDRPWLDGLVRQVNTTGGGARGGEPELCLVLGDLVETGMRAELAIARDILRGLRMPFYAVPGNHDCPPGTPGGAPGAGLEAYEELFPGRRNYAFEHRGWQFVALDSTAGSAYEHVGLNGEAMEFARQTAAQLDRQRPVILFTHFPVAPDAPYALTDGAELLAIFHGLNLPVVFGGHYHGMTRFVVDGIELLTNRCASRWREIHDGSDARGYFLCTARADGAVEHEFVPYGGPA